MRFLAFSLCLASIAAGQSAGTFVDPPRYGWFATNQFGICSLKRVIETTDAKLEFLFLSPSGPDVRSHRITFQVNATPAHLVWPVRLSPGSDRKAQPIEIGADSSSSTLLADAGVQRLLAYLKDGTSLDVVYSLSDGVERNLFLDGYKFAQSVAMFEVCGAHVA